MGVHAGFIGLEASCNRASLPVGGLGTFQAIIAVTPTKEAEEYIRHNPRPVHLVFCIDISGSMAGDKLETAKLAALRRASRDLNKGDLISLITFADHVEEHIKLGKQESIYDELRRKITHLEVGKLTSMYEGIARASRIGAKSSPEYIRRILLITDGRPTKGITDPTKLIDLARENSHQDSLLVDVIGIGSDYDYNLTREISSASNGQLMHAAEAKDVENLSRTLVDKYKGTITDRLPPLKIKLLEHNGGNTNIEEIIQLSPEIKNIHMKYDDSMYSYELGPLTIARPYILVLRMNTQGYDAGKKTIVDIDIAGLRSELSIDFTNDLPMLQKEEDARPRVAYMIVSRLSQIAEAIMKGDKQKEQEGADLLDKLLMDQRVVDVIYRDVILTALITKYQLSKTAVDDRTRIDNVTKPFV